MELKSVFNLLNVRYMSEYTTSGIRQTGFISNNQNSNLKVNFGKCSSYFVLERPKIHLQFGNRSFQAYVQNVSDACKAIKQVYKTVNPTFEISDFSTLVKQFYSFRIHVMSRVSLKTSYLLYIAPMH